MWSKGPKCEKVVNQLWNNHNTRGIDKPATMKGLDFFFQEYKIGAVNKELRRIDDLLKEEDKWDYSEKSIKSNKALEGQRNNLLQIEKAICRQKIGKFGLSMVIETYNYFVAKQTKEGKQMLFIS